METGEKFVWKGHDKEKMQKRVVQLCTLTKILSKIGLFQEKDASWAHIYVFEKKQQKFLGLLFHPWKFWSKQSYSFLKNPAKLYDTYWEWSQNLCDFFFIAPEDCCYFVITPGNSTLYFFNISGKRKSWNSRFHYFT